MSDMTKVTHRRNKGGYKIVLSDHEARALCDWLAGDPGDITDDLYLCVCDALREVGA